MYNKMVKSLSRLHKDQKGITGLETAIILIAFVTVAAVLAYTVLTAGIFSSERGKEAVYAGLESTQSTLTLKGSVLAEDLDSTSTAKLYLTLGMAVSGASVDLNRLVYNYWDSNGLRINDLAGVTYAGGATSLEGNESVLVTVTLGGDAGFTSALAAYDVFTLQIIPPTGATVTVQRTLPGSVDGLIDLY